MPAGQRQPVTLLVGGGSDGVEDGGPVGHCSDRLLNNGCVCGLLGVVFGGVAIALSEGTDMLTGSLLTRLALAVAAPAPKDPPPAVAVLFEDDADTLVE